MLPVRRQGSCARRQKSRILCKRPTSASSRQPFQKPPRKSWTLQYGGHSGTMKPRLSPQLRLLSRILRRPNSQLCQRSRNYSAESYSTPLAKHLAEAIKVNCPPPPNLDNTQLTKTTLDQWSHFSRSLHAPMPHLFLRRLLHHCPRRRPRPLRAPR